MGNKTENKRSNSEFGRVPSWGESLTHDECWELWEAERDFQNDYDNFESGLESEAKALTDPFYGYYAMEAALYNRTLYWVTEHPTIYSVAAFFDRELGYNEMLKLQQKQQEQADGDYLASEQERLEEDEQLSGDIDWTPIDNYSRHTSQPIVSIYHDRISELLTE